MKLRPEQRKELSGRAYYLLLFAVCLAAFAVVAAVNLAQGKSLIWLPDGEALYYNFFVYEGELIRSVVGSIGQPDFAIPLFSFESGYGADVLATMAGCLNDPFNLISAFVPVSVAEYAFEGLVFLRFFLAASAFSAYALSKGNEKMPTLCGAVCYVLCGYALFWGVLRHPNFLNESILLPLLLLGADRVFDKKSPVLLIAAAAFQFFFSVYFSYMMLVVLIAYCLLKYCFSVRDKSFRGFVGLVGRFVAFLLVAALIAGIAVVPLVLTLTSMGRVGVTREIPALEVFAFYWQYSGNLLGASLDARGLVLGPVGVLGVLALFIAGRALPLRKKAPWMIGLAICFIGSLLPPFGSAMNGFGYSTDRWMVALSLCAAYSVVLVLPTLRKFSRLQWIVFCVCATLFAALTAVYVAESSGSIAYFSIVAAFVLTTVLFVALGCKARTGVLSGVLSGCVVLGAFLPVLVLSGLPNTPNALGTYQTWGVAQDVTHTIPLNDAEEEILSDYRVDRDSILGMRNQAFAQGFKGADFFSSFYNQNVDDFRRSLGISDNHSNYIFNGHDLRFAVEGVMGARYYVAVDEEKPAVPFGYKKIADLGTDFKGKSYALYENELALPIAFVYDSAVSESEYSQLSMVERAELLTKACVLEGVSESSSDVVEMGASRRLETTIEAREGAVCENGVIKVFENNAKIVLKVKGGTAGENAVVFENLAMEPMSLEERHVLRLENDPAAVEPSAWSQLTWRPDRSTDITVKRGDTKQEFKLSNSLHSGYGGKTDWVVNMGYSEKPAKSYVVRIESPGVYTYDDIYAATQDLEAISSDLKKLQSQNTAAISFSVNGMDVQLEAEVNGDDKTRYLFVSVPYSAGWSATVDGKPAEILKANVGFMAIAVDGASHDIQFTYCTPGLVTGAWCSVAGLILLVGIVVGRRQWAKRQNRKEQHEQDD